MKDFALLVRPRDPIGPRLADAVRERVASLDVTAHVTCALPTRLTLIPFRRTAMVLVTATSRASIDTAERALASLGPTAVCTRTTEVVVAPSGVGDGGTCTLLT